MLEELNVSSRISSSELGNPGRNLLQDLPELVRRFLLHLPTHLAINIIPVAADIRSG